MSFIPALAAFTCSDSAAFFGFIGVSAALVFCNLGSAYGTAKSAVGIASMGITNPDAVMKNILPVVMAGILGIYGLIISVMIVQNVKDTGYALYNAYAHLAAGLACGLSSLASGLAIGIVGDSGVRAAGQNEKLFVPMALILIFAEALGMYGLIVGILISSVSKAECTM
eukprot:TRINITY_DN42270_c0_g1_i1.p1 TRINITY_DN42270_c0_g1~~TRINITY_DN42270_c0_g1_i1.p1  ORF type:complete len:169 (+),score=31.85 TRINITY_DN42270_c0_g1_i1:26-532(+)